MTQDTNLRTTYPATIAANGTAMIRVTPNRDPWVVTQVSVFCPSGTVGTAAINGAFLSYFIPTGDVIGDAPPVQLQPGDVLTLLWEGATPGDQATAQVFYDRGTYT